MSITRFMGEVSFIFNSDFSGEIQICKEIDESINTLRDDNWQYLYTTLPEIKKVIQEWSKDMLQEKVSITGMDDNEESITRKPITFELNANDLYDLFISKTVKELIAELEQIDAHAFYRRFMRSLDVTAKDILDGNAPTPNFDEVMLGARNLNYRQGLLLVRSLDNGEGAW